jgi:hypothetical protein
MKDVREIFEGQGILEKTSDAGVVKILIVGATLESSSNSVEDSLIVGIDERGYEYAVDSEDVIISADGTIEFEALGANYRIREITETDDLDNLNPDGSGEEEEPETNE